MANGLHTQLRYPWSKLSLVGHLKRRTGVSRKVIGKTASGMVKRMKMAQHSLVGLIILCWNALLGDVALLLVVTLMLLVPVVLVPCVLLVPLVLRLVLLVLLQVSVKQVLPRLVLRVQQLLALLVLLVSLLLEAPVLQRGVELLFGVLVLWVLGPE